MDEEERLRQLHELEILDTHEDDAFDRIAQVAALICDMPIAMISLVDRDRQWFKARVGLEDKETPRDHAFCAHAILDSEIMAVRDARRDRRFKGNPLVRGHPRIRAYAGAPIYGPEGAALGTVCVIDQKPRALSKMQRQALKLLARQAEDLIALRVSLLKVQRRLHRGERRSLRAAAKPLGGTLTAN